MKVDKSESTVGQVPRKIPYTIKNNVEAELRRMESNKSIEKIQEPTKWVNTMVVVESQISSLSRPKSSE